MSSNFENSFIKGVELIREGRSDEAEKLLLACIRLNPNAPEPYINLGAISFSRNDWTASEKYFRSALRFNPYDQIALYNLGLTLHKQGQLYKSRNVFQKVILVNPGNDIAINELGTVYNDLDLPKKAIECFNQTLKVNPKNQLALYNLGRTLDIVGSSDQGLPHLKKAYRLDANDSKSLALIYSYYRSICDWTNTKKYSSRLTRLTEAELSHQITPGENPFLSVTRIDDPKINLAVSRAWSKVIKSSVASAIPFKFNRNLNPKKIRVGYVSNGFRNFPTTHNISGVFENHNRKSFQIYAYSFGPDDKSTYRKRVVASVDRFVEIGNKNVYQIAKRIYRDRIDILVDLKGFTQGARPEIFAIKCAPIQVSLLGFIGTSGSDYHDYFIGDKTVLPPPLAKYFSEKIVYMPHTYWPTDNKLQVSKNKYKKSDFGIPQNAFVFASFNQTYKVQEQVFDTWLNILRRVPNSILFMYTRDEAARDNLRSHASAKKIDPQRIIFANELPKDKHLARIRDIVDLTLDTLIVNGHTTTTDCLWVGVPVVALLGKHFSSRVSASMLSAVGLPELITKDLKHYQSLAIRLANNPAELTRIREKLLKKRDTTPLFDTESYTKYLESAYTIMVKRFKQGKNTSDIILE